MERYGKNDYELYVGKNAVRDDSWSMRFGRERYSISSDVYVAYNLR